MRQTFISTTTTLFALAALVLPSRAQMGSMPDVQIMVAPGLGTWSVATVYPKAVPHAESEARLKRLSTLTGWKLEKLEFDDKRLDRNLLNSDDSVIRKEAQKVGAAPVMSSASFQTTAALVDPATGTLALEPFLRAFREYNKVNITYLIPGSFTYKGPTQYKDSRIEMALFAQGGAYTYQVQLKEHHFDVLNLPTKEVAPKESYRAAENTSAPRLLLSTGVVALLALGVAVIAYALTQRFLHR